jgi:hypothetical protein
VSGENFPSPTAGVEGLPRSLRCVPQTALHSGRDDRSRSAIPLRCQMPNVVWLLVNWDGLEIEFRETTNQAIGVHFFAEGMIGFFCRDGSDRSSSIPIDVE